MLDLTEYRGIQDVCAQTELAGDFLGDGESVPGDHLHQYAHLFRGRNSALRIGTKRVRERNDAQELPLSPFVGAGYTQRAVAPRSEVIHALLRLRLDLGIPGRQIDDDLRSPLGRLEGLAV